MTAEDAPDLPGTTEADAPAADAASPAADAASPAADAASPAADAPAANGPPPDRASRFDRADFRARAAGRGLDKAAPSSPGTPAPAAPADAAGTSRAERFDRAGFGGLRAAEVGGAEQPPTPEPPPEATAPPTKTAEPPYEGDALLVADHLRELGWSRQKIAMILRGPDNHSIHEIACPSTSGEPLPEVSGEPSGEYGKERPRVRAKRNQDNPLGVSQVQIIDAIALSRAGKKEKLAALSAMLDDLPGELQAYLAAALSTPSSRSDGYMEGRDAIFGLATAAGNDPAMARLIDLKRAILADEVALLLPLVPRGTGYQFAPTLAEFAQAARKLELYRGMDQSLFEP